MQKIKYFFRTIYDIGLIRNFGRTRYEFRKFIYNFSPGKINLFLSEAYEDAPAMKDNLKSLQTLKINKSNYSNLYNIY